jgi:hypothetical protein
MRLRRKSGSVIAESPAVLMMLFMGFVFPLIGICVFGYRAACLYLCVRDVCYKAATSSTYTLAKSNGNTAWTSDLAAWGGLTSGGTPIYEIITTYTGSSTSTTAGSTTTSTSALSTVDTYNNIYFIQVSCVGNITPLLGSGWKVFGASIPGLNANYSLSMKQQVYVENPNGLTQ